MSEPTPAWIAEDASRASACSAARYESCLAFLTRAASVLARAGVEDVRGAANTMLRCEIDMALALGGGNFSYATISAIEREPRP